MRKQAFVMTASAIALATSILFPGKASAIGKAGPFTIESAGYWRIKVTNTSDIDQSVGIWGDSFKESALADTYWESTIPAKSSKEFSWKAAIAKCIPGQLDAGVPKEHHEGPIYPGKDCTSTPTNTTVPTNTPTDVPNSTPTNTTVPTNTPTDVPNSTPTNTTVPTNTPTDVPNSTPTNTTVPTNTPTDVPNSTPTNTTVPTATPTNTAEPDQPQPPTPTTHQVPQEHPDATYIVVPTCYGARIVITLTKGQVGSITIIFEDGTKKTLRDVSSAPFDSRPPVTADQLEFDFGEHTSAVVTVEFIGQSGDIKPSQEVKKLTNCDEPTTEPSASPTDQPAGQPTPTNVPTPEPENHNAANGVDNSGNSGLMVGIAAIMAAIGAFLMRRKATR